jgi:glycosyltransferase involved in cell wall biosynthesis
MSAAAPIRVVFMDDHLDQGGSTVNLLRLLPRLAAHRIEPVVLTSDTGDDLGWRFREAGITTLAYRFGTDRDLYDDRVLGAYRLLAGAAPAAVVASHETVSFDLLRYAPAGVFRVGAVRNDDDWSYRLIANHASWLDAVIGNSRRICRLSAEQLPAALERVVYIPNGVNTPDELPPATDGEGMLRIVYIGRLEERQKRVRRYVPIWVALCRRDVAIRWTFIGDGPERAYLEQSMRPTPRQQIRFVGNIAHEKVLDCCRQQDVVVLVSEYEGFTNAVVEAMACGLVPVVTAQRGEWPDMVDAASGFCVKPDDPAAFADVLASLKPGSDELAQRRQAAFRKVRDRFSHDAQVSAWAALLHAGVRGRCACWPAHVRFAGPPMGEGGRRPAFWYHPVWRPLRRKVHFMTTRKQDG